MGKEMGYLLDGLSRDERLIRELLPESVKIEDRDTTDLLHLMSDLSSHIIYFNNGSIPDGNWEQFFKADFNLLNQLITKFDLQVYLKYFTKLEIKLERAVHDQAVMEALAQIFRLIFVVGINMYELSKLLLETSHIPFSNGRLTHILEDIQGVIEKLKAYNRQVFESYQVVFIEERFFESARFADFVDAPEVQLIFSPDQGIRECTGPAFIVIKDLFEELRTSFNRVLNGCKYYINEHPMLEQHYSPHLAMVITFLELYGHLKTDINQLTAKHLDFYYQRILGFDQLPAVPDTVNLLFSALPDAKEVLMEKGTLISGKLPEFRDELFYELDQRLVLSKAHISALKTLSVIRTVPFFIQEKGLLELQLLKSAYQNPEPDFFVKNSAGIPSWPMLGNDLQELTAKAGNATIAETGILIASPVLYQPAGKRKIEIRLFIHSTAYTDFINQLQLSEGIDHLKYQVLENAFVMEFTGPDGWEQSRFKRISLDAAAQAIVLELYQDKMDLPFALYSPLHGDIPGITWPAVRLLLNKETNFNPLVYLQQLMISRITVEAAVSGLTDYILQNNIGNLSNTTVFQPFGPIAPVKGYLDLVNPNVFNKFLSKLELRMEWVGLPEVPGGFETHYQEYGANIKNSSFRARLLSHRYTASAAANIQNTFPLFEDDFDANFEPVLKESTTFKTADIDVKELAFTNDYALGKEVQLLPGEMTEGTLRIEFCSPAFGFGHRAFPAVFSEVALHNSRRFVKKRGLPEQPYTPLLKNVFVDYTQVSSEQLNNATGNTPGLNSITLIYLQPFGYEQVFPGEIRSAYPLIPREDYDSNFYIGFDKINPGEEVAILFQLEEKTTHEAAVTVQPLQWSYLYENTWLSMNEKYILSDATENFVTTGIVRLIVPEDISLGNSIMPGELYWMRVAVEGRNVVKSKIKALFVNAVTATRVVEKNAADFLSLPAGTLKTIVNPVKGIQNIWQLFPSFAGRPAENKVDFYIRVSQRLRHKNRLLMSRDIEQAVLENFPEILIAKCLRTEEAGTIRRSGFSGLRLILVALTENTGSALGNLKPMVSLDTLCKVKEFLRPRLSPQVRISVENPVYERVKVVCKVKLVVGNSAEHLFYSKQLENDINDFISPWYFRADSHYRIGRKLFVEEMRIFIRSKPYVSDIEHFGLAHFYQHANGTKMNDSKSLKTAGYLAGSVPEAIFIPAESHFIEIVEAEEAQGKKLNIGLNYLRVGDELFIGKASKPAPVEEKVENVQYYNWVISKNN